MVLVLLSNELVLRMVMVDSIATASGKDGGVTPQGVFWSMTSGHGSWQRQKKKHLILN